MFATIFSREMIQYSNELTAYDKYEREFPENCGTVDSSTLSENLRIEEKLWY
jgi:hypothetical protein